MIGIALQAFAVCYRFGRIGFALPRGPHLLRRKRALCDLLLCCRQDPWRANFLHRRARAFYRSQIILYGCSQAVVELSKPGR